MKAFRSWWLHHTSGYRTPVSEPQRPPRVAALPRPPEFNELQGMWIAVAESEIVAVAETSHQLALKLHEMDHRKLRQVVIEFVRATTDSYIVGAG